MLVTGYDAFFLLSGAYGYCEEIRVRGAFEGNTGAAGGKKGTDIRGNFL